MKIFEKAKMHYATLGISPSNQSIQNDPFNKKVLFGFLLFGCLLSSQFVYICRVNTNSGFMEYTNIICTASASALMFICFAVIFIRKAALFDCIDSTQIFIDISKAVDNWKLKISQIQFHSKNRTHLCISGCAHPKSRKFFLKICQQTERLSEIIFMVVQKIPLQLVMLPKFIVSFGVYFITNSGSSSFQLPFPMW